MIELTNANGESVMVNMQNVNTITNTDTGCTIWFTSGQRQDVTESIGDILHMMIGEE